MHHLWFRWRVRNGRSPRHTRPCVRGWWFHAQLTECETCGMLNPLPMRENRVRWRHGLVAGSCIFCGCKVSGETVFIPNSVMDDEDDGEPLA